MNIFVNCNNLDVFKEFVKTYSEENKKHHFIFGRQDINYDLQNTDRELVQILIENDIVDYELLHASGVDFAVPDEWKTDLYKLCSNMSLQMLAPWFLVKHRKSLPLLCIEEDITLGVNLKQLEGKGNKAILSPLSVWKYGSDKAVALGNSMLDYVNYYTSIYYRKIVGCPRYYEEFNVDMFEKYCDRFFNNELLYESVKKSKAWHHNYLDEHFHSCSPVLFNKFKSFAKACLCGKSFMCKTNFSALKPMLKTKILHYNCYYKLEALKRTLEAK